jgi:hypothetical protein
MTVADAAGPALDPLEPETRLYRHLHSHPDGLSQREAERRLVEHGPNEIRRRGRPRVWRSIVAQLCGYDLYLGIPPEEKLPVMDLHEILAEKLCGSWLFGHAKHYADIAWIGSLLKRDDLYREPEVRADITELLEMKLETNQRLISAKRVNALTSDLRRQRLEDPDSQVDPKRSWDTISYLGTQQFKPEALQLAVTKVIVPILCDES